MANKKSQQKNKNPNDKTVPNKSSSRKTYSKDKAVFYEQGRVDMYPVDPYND